MDLNTLIVVKGEDKTASVKEMNFDKENRVVSITYSNGKSYPYGIGNLQVFKEPKNVSVLDKRVYSGDTIESDAATVQIFGKYSRVIYKNGKTRLFPSDEIRIVRSVLENGICENRFLYLKEIANAVGLFNDKGQNILATYYNRINYISDESVMADFLNGKTVKPSANVTGSVIYPFGVNLSQKQAVDNALRAKISFIEGPPGTGKTQTILNIIANAVIRGKSVAVVSGNNSATANVYDKLQKYGMGFLAAQLGNADNKNRFFEQTALVPDLSRWAKEQDIHRLNAMLADLEIKMKQRNRLAELLAEQDALQKEKLHFDDYYSALAIHSSSPIFSEKLPPQKILNFAEEYELLFLKGKKISFFKKIALRFTYKLKKINFSVGSKEISAHCQRIFYERQLKALANECRQLKSELSDFDFEKRLKEYADLSMRFFQNQLYEKYRDRKRRNYAATDLFFHPKEFIGDFPVVLSTTYSLSSCLAPTFSYDYVIVDESSQVDLATGALALSCAKRAVIVGDLKQLPNVVTAEQKEQTASIFSQYKIPNAYRFHDHSLLSSMIELFPEAPKVLLREHYRCHPEIIGFCNQMFYDHELIIMTDARATDKTMAVYRTAAGNLARGHINKRQIEVIAKEVIEEQNLNLWDNSVGIVTPYRAQAELLQKQFEGTTVKAETVDKFQGQERSVMILSTVDNEIGEFVADPNRLNVAVSRAKDKFIVVTDGNDNDKDSPIHELIEYIRYHNHEIINSKIGSVFDYLYEINSKAREEILRKYGRVSQFDSENLAFLMIKGILKNKPFTHLGVAMHVPFRSLLGDLSGLSEREFSFSTNDWTHVDFLIYSRVTHLPVLVIEVDGFQFHNNEKQKERDALKDSILAKYGIPILRLNTTDSSEKERVCEKLRTLVSF